MAITEESIKYIINIDSTIEEAWSVIEKNEHRSVIVVNGETVVGTLSDGDLRKAMLAKRLLSTPIKHVMNVNFKSISRDEIEHAQSIIKKYDIFLLPVVDEEMLILDLIVR
ncbi:nucleotidyltransferase [Candidatus Magnetobacterium bavaricum]|uniref:Nucleotidyltransferase n=1 Tax=Candidatus Magnetobacterium bavaricum TaxID=29290 RepID=A0A0F3GHI3_9BACT|nr:nucleotidyltransferase [Candidatus Magnetobacterium bavaricum]